VLVEFSTVFIVHAVPAFAGRAVIQHQSQLHAVQCDGLGRGSYAAPKLRRAVQQTKFSDWAIERPHSCESVGRSNTIADVKHNKQAARPSIQHARPSCETLTDSRRGSHCQKVRLH
jgi:hypothetical protein